jgi:hypothetical protein
VTCSWRPKEFFRRCKVPLLCRYSSSSLAVVEALVERCEGELNSGVVQNSGRILGGTEYKRSDRSCSMFNIRTNSNPHSVRRSIIALLRWIFRSTDRVLNDDFHSGPPTEFQSTLGPVLAGPVEVGVGTVSADHRQHILLCHCGWTGGEKHFKGLGDPGLGRTIIVHHHMPPDLYQILGLAEDATPDESLSLRFCSRSPSSKS